MAIRELTQEMVRSSAPVAWQELPVPDSGDWIQLLDPDEGPMTGAFRNLLRRSANGEIAWTAPLPKLYATGRPDCYTDVRWENEALVANTWSGYLVRLDPCTGEIEAATFAK